MDEGRKRDPKTSVPEIAHIGGIVVGQSTMDDLERTLGKGLPQNGGHAHGGRLWRAEHPSASIDADGFYYFDGNGKSYDGGRQLDALCIEAVSERVDAPLARRHADRFLFLARFGLGAQYDDVRIAQPARVEPTTLTWEAQGFVRVSHINHYTTTRWSARLEFTRGRLSSIRINSGVS